MSGIRTGATPEQIKAAAKAKLIDYPFIGIRDATQRMRTAASYLVPPDHRIVPVADLLAVVTFARGLDDLADCPDDALTRLDALIGDEQ